MQDYYTSSVLAQPNSRYNHHSAEIAVSFIKMLSNQINGGSISTRNIWQERFIRDVFGIETSNGNRQFIYAYVATDDEQERLLFSARIALFLTCADRSPNGEVYYCVTDQKQSTVIFKDICDIVVHCESLRRYIKLSLCQKKLIYKPLNSSFQIIIPNEYKLIQNAHGVLVDESFVFNNCSCFNLKNIGQRTREKQPLLVVTASAQTTNKNKIFHSLHQKAINVLAGKDTDSIFYPTIIHELEHHNNS